MKPLSPLILASLLFSWSVLTSALAAEVVLVDLGSKFDLTQVETVDARLSLAESSIGPALRISTGHQQTWPGITLRAPGGHWDLSLQDLVSLKLKDVGTNPVTVFCRVDNPGADGQQHCVTGSLRLEPGQTDTLKVPFQRTSGDELNGKLFGMRGYPATAGGPGTVNLSNITQLLVFVSKPAADFSFEVSDFRASGTWTRPTAWVSDATPFFPFIDPLVSTGTKIGRVNSNRWKISKSGAHWKPQNWHPNQVQKIGTSTAVGVRPADKGDWHFPN